MGQARSGKRTRVRSEIEGARCRRRRGRERKGEARAPASGSRVDFSREAPGVSTNNFSVSEPPSSKQGTQEMTHVSMLAEARRRLVCISIYLILSQPLPRRVAELVRLSEHHRWRKDPRGRFSGRRSKRRLVVAVTRSGQATRAESAGDAKMRSLSSDMCC